MTDLRPPDDGASWKPAPDLPPGPGEPRDPAGGEPKENGAHDILPGALYSLREAAELTGIPEGRIRRAILLEDLPALAAPDDRQYLLLGRTLEDYLHSRRTGGVGSGPPPRSSLAESAFFFALLLVIAVLLILASSVASRSPESGRSIRTPQKIEATSPPGPAGEQRNAPPP